MCCSHLGKWERTTCTRCVAQAGFHSSSLLSPHFPLSLPLHLSPSLFFFSLSLPLPLSPSLCVCVYSMSLHYQPPFPAASFLALPPPAHVRKGMCASAFMLHELHAHASLPVAFLHVFSASGKLQHRLACKCVCVCVPKYIHPIRFSWCAAFFHTTNT